MKTKKGQVGPKEFLVTLVVAALLAIIGLMVFSKVSNTSNALFDNVVTHKINESVTIVNDIAGDTNSTLLAEDGYIANSEEVVNGSTGAKVILVRNVEYKITLLGGASGDLATRGNFTLFNATNTSAYGYNNTALKITYNTNEKSAGRVTKESMDTTVLDSFELGTIALIVLAAVVILTALFMIGGRN